RETYHRPTDTAATIDADGMAKVTAVAREAVEYLAGREEPLTSTLQKTGESASATSLQGAGGATASASQGAAGAAAASPGASREGSPFGARSTGTPRRVSFGAVPDFGYAGLGVRLAGVVAGSPAEKSGMKEGDVIVKVGSTSVGSLKDFSEILGSLRPGDRISVRFLRDGQ